MEGARAHLLHQAEVAPEDSAARIAQLQAQLGAVQNALILAESRAAALGAAAHVPDGASGGSAPSVPTPSPPPVSSHAPPSEPPVTPTEIKIEGSGGPIPETIERVLEGLIEGSDLPSQEVEFLLRGAGPVGLAAPAHSRGPRSRVAMTRSRILTA